MNQDQTPQPNYDFIMSQPGQTPAKKPKSPILFAGGILFALVAAIIILVFVIPGSNVKKTDVSNNANGVFVDSILGNDDSRAYAMLSSDVRVNYESQEDFTKKVGDPLRKTSELYACQQVNSSEQIQNSGYVYKCEGRGLLFWFGVRTNTSTDSESVIGMCAITDKEMTACVS